MNKSIGFIMLLISLGCSPKRVDSADAPKDSLASHEATSSEPISNSPDQGFDLDIENYSVYNYTDTSVVFKQPSYLGDHEMLEPDYLKDNTQVERTAEGLQFQLKNKKIKILKEKKNAEDEEYVRYSFLKSWDEIGQWQVLSMYNEGFSYLLIDQTDGTEYTIWSDPVFSPDKKYFITGSADIDAGFIPNGFQLWTFKDNRPLKLWEKELTEWGAENLIWTSDNYIVGEQIYRDANLGESDKRIIKMRLVSSHTP